MYQFNNNNDDHISIKSWFQKWEMFIVDCDFKSARNLFENEVVSFGTWMNVVQGLNELETGDAFFAAKNCKISRSTS